MLLVERYDVGFLHTNCYFIKDKDTNSCAIIDPGSKSTSLTNKVMEENDSIKYILLTHGHFDHIKEVKRYKDITNAKVVIYKSENVFLSNKVLNLSNGFKKNIVEPFSADILLNDNETISLGNSIIKLIHTPGHTSGSSCYIIDNMIFSGDTLMKENIGRTDLATGDSSQLNSSLYKIINLKGDYIVYPGHGDITTLSHEYEYNPYIGEIIDEYLS